MTRFRNKLIWFWDFIDCNMKVVLVSRDCLNPWNITLYFGLPKCIELNSLGEVLFNGKYSFESKKCNSQSWNQYLNRYFPKSRYIKSGELYVYDIPAISKE